MKQTIQRSGHKAFRYTHSDGSAITDKKLIKYCASLGIPPAWNDVQIAVNKRAKILATGHDKAGRTQYIYHPTFRARQEAAKFERVLRFARALPAMREVVERDLKRRALDYKKVMATIISIMDQTHIRVGNETYAKTNNSYGLTTLRSKHTSVQGDTITFDFIGKSGKHHVKRITDHSLARIVRQLDDLPGYEVFKYYEAKKLRDVHSSDVNNYIKSVMGEEFSAKDFRTWAGTLQATIDLILAERSTDQADSKTQRQKEVTACVKRVAQKLGNTPAIARASYINPRIFEMYMKGTVRTMKAQAGTKYLSQEEHCTLELLEAK